MDTHLVGLVDFDLHLLQLIHPRLAQHDRVITNVGAHQERRCDPVQVHRQRLSYRRSTQRTLYMDASNSTSICTVWMVLVASVTLASSCVGGEDGSGL